MVAVSAYPSSRTTSKQRFIESRNGSCSMSTIVANRFYETALWLWLRRRACGAATHSVVELHRLPLDSSASSSSNTVVIVVRSFQFAMREIITLQFGRQSNYIGTHLLNVEVRRTFVSACDRAHVRVAQHLRVQKHADEHEHISADILFRSDCSRTLGGGQSLDDKAHEQRSARVVSFDRIGSSSLEPHSKVDATTNTWYRIPNLHPFTGIFHGFFYSN